VPHVRVSAKTGENVSVFESLVRMIFGYITFSFPFTFVLMDSDWIQDMGLYGR
jgi:hypothetical protein